tara:strand:- start:1332 stop:1565 length:234 start_codon:yes stop_codon:yes gene_type:complete
LKKQYVTEYYIDFVNLCHFHAMLTFMLQESVAANGIKTGCEHKMPNESNAITEEQLWGQPPGQDFQMSLQSKEIGQV